MTVKGVMPESSILNGFSVVGAFGPREKDI